MTLEERLRRDRLDPPLPRTLTPPPDLADTVLHAVRWRRRRGQLVAVAAAVAVAVVLPITVLRPAGGQPPAATPAPTEAGPSPAPPAPTRLPALDGGPRALHAFTAAASGRTSVLDVRTGRYRELPYETVQLSPDLARIAVMDRRGRTGIAGRAALLRDGDRAVSWTALPAGSGLLWSPDGSALLLATLDKSAGAVSHTVLRYDLRSRLVTSTPVPAGIALIGTPTWAANSRDYLLLPVAEESGGGVRPGPLRTLHPDGALAPGVDGPGGVVDGPAAYSPSRRLMVADTSQIMTVAPTPTPVLDVRTGAVVGMLPAGGRVVGWYDERTVLRLAEGPALLLVDARTGRTGRTVPLPGGPELTAVQVGSSAGVSSEAPRF